MSENLALLGAYSDAMFAGDQEAVFEFWSPDFVSHVTERVNPDAVGTDIRGYELEWWNEVRSAFPDFVFTVDLLVESGDLVISNCLRVVWRVEERAARRGGAAGRSPGARVAGPALGTLASAPAGRLVDTVEA